MVPLSLARLCGFSKSAESKGMLGILFKISGAELLARIACSIVRSVCNAIGKTGSDSATTKCDCTNCNGDKAGAK